MASKIRLPTIREKRMDISDKAAGLKVSKAMFFNEPSIC
jgi:hypothetical protein